MPSQEKLLSKIATTRFPSLPSENHESFMRYIHRVCLQQNISAFVKGSLAKGTAMKDSDVDLVVTGLTSAEQFDMLIGAFDEILLSEHFNPTSTYMVIYNCGLAVEYDLRKTITEYDLSKSLSIGTGQYMLSNTDKDRESFDSFLCPKRDCEYSVLMIAQMCCAKLLCQKAELAREIYCDRMELLYGNHSLQTDLRHIVHSESNLQFAHRLKEQVLAQRIMDVHIKEYFLNLFERIENTDE